MSKKSTIQDLARELNVTASTVSRALNDHPRISREMKRAVREAAEVAGYQHNQLAASLRSGKSYTLGVIVPTTDRSFFSSVIRNIEEIVNRSGFNVIICQSNDSTVAENNNLDALIRARVDGIAISLAKETTDISHFDKIAKMGIPLVVFDRIIDNCPFSTVDIDDYACSYQATKHLIQQGFKRIAHIGGVQHMAMFRKRLRGYKDALADSNMAFDDDLVVLCALKLESGKKAAQQLLSLKDKADGIFCASDYSALGAMQTAKSMGINVPKDLGIIGFANEPFTAFVEPALTTIDQHPKEMGEIIANLLFEQMSIKNTEGVADYVPRRVTLSGKMIIRGSSVRH